MRILAKGLSAIILFVFLFTGTAFGQAAPGINEDKADKLKELGLFMGGSNGFELDRAPTRLEAAVMLVRLLGRENEAKQQDYRHPFSDVPAWASPYVGYLCTKGYSKGISAELYGSAQEMTAPEFVTYILRSLGYNDSWGAFDWNYSLDAALNVGLIGKEYYDSLQSKVFLRDDAVKLCYSALNLLIYGKTERLVNKLITDGAVKREAAEKVGISTTDSFYTLQDYGEINGVPFFDSITADLDPWYGKAYKSWTKAIRYKIDASKLPGKAAGFTKLGLRKIYKTDLSAEEITQYVNNITKDGWTREPDLDSDGYFRFYCDFNNGWLITLLDSQDNVLAYTLVHFLGVGENTPEGMPDATHRYEAVDLGAIEGVPFFNALKIYGLGGTIIPMVDREKLPEGMKGFKKISLGTMPEMKKEDMNKEIFAQNITGDGGWDYSDILDENTTCISGAVMLVTIADDSGKPLGYTILRRIMKLPA